MAMQQAATANAQFLSFPSNAAWAPQPVEAGEDALAGIGTVHSLARGAELYSQGDAADSWFQVRSGVIRTCKLLNDGRRQIESFLTAGDFLGFEDMGSHGFAAEAITAVTVVRYSKARVEKLAEENPRFAARLLKITLKRLGEAKIHLTLLGRKNAEEKLASFLLEMMDDLGGGAEIDLPMSRSDIADYLGLTIETVSRTLSAFRQEGLVELPNAHRVIVLDRDTLETLRGDE